MLPLGPSTLRETRTSRTVAPGVTYTRIERGQASSEAVYTVDVAFKVDSTEAERIASRLRAEGHSARVEAVSRRAPDAPGSGPMGHLVRTGSFATVQEANAHRDRLMAAGYTGLRPVDTSEDGGETTGPWTVHVLEIDPEIHTGTVTPALSTDIGPGRETLSSLSRRKGTLAGITGGYFVMGAEDGTPGDMAGISVLHGKLVSEAVDGRTALILPPGSGKGAAVASIRDTVTANSSDGTTREVDGLNRKPGLIRSCGGEGDMPADLPKHDFTCTDASEVILFTPMFGTTTEPGPGIEAVLNASGRVTELREHRGGSIPSEGSVLSGTGEGADWLRAHAQPGMTVQVAVRISAEGAALPAGASVVNGGPRLLRAGTPEITAYAEGFVWADNPEFYYRFGARRNPRTLAGVTAQGKLLLVVVDGRQPGYSIGASFEESALLMQSLGAREAVNLDGGGSSALTVSGELLTRPSDATGERPLGDAILVLP
ncbi:MAG TPA: phosphodiester glycosidase family protein [Myxococcaceae bacterium]